MHSLETGIIVSIAAFFFFSFLSFTFMRETNISKEISKKYENERKSYEMNGEKDYNPELINNIISIIKEGSDKNDGDNVDHEE